MDKYWDEKAVLSQHNPASIATQKPGFEPVNRYNSYMGEQEKIVHQKFQEYGRNAKNWMAKCVLLLPEIEERQIWKRKGFYSIYEYAAKLAGMSREKVNESLRILHKIEDKPALMAVAERKGVLAVKPVATIATVESEEFWAEKAGSMGKNELETYVHECRLQEELDIIGRPRTEFGSKEDFENVTMELGAEVVQKLEKLKGKGSWNDLMAKLLAEREANLEKEKPEAVRTESRPIPVKIEKFVLERTNGNCAYPGCPKPYEILHHTKRWAIHRTHDPDYIQPLCRSHERLAHLGLIENELGPPENWHIKEEANYAEAKYDIDVVVQQFRRVKNQ